MTTPTLIKLYELTGAEENRRFSPYCWRIRLALRHKGLPFVGLPWRFKEKAAIAFSGQTKVPVIVDREEVVHDSWAIAEYLEATYPQQPSLFGGPEAKALSRFITHWVETTLHPDIARLVLVEIPTHLDETDRAYFRRSREMFLGKSLEDYCADREAYLPTFRARLAPLRATLEQQLFLAGAAPAWADYVVFAGFQWARSVSTLPLLASDDLPLLNWCDRLLDAFDGEARNAPSCC